MDKQKQDKALATAEEAKYRVDKTTERDKRIEALRSMGFETAKAELEYLVYQAAKLLEDLENAGKFQGNGHHARQRVSAFAVEELKSRWKECENE